MRHFKFIKKAEIEPTKGCSYEFLDPDCNQCEVKSEVCDDVCDDVNIPCSDGCDIYCESDDDDDVCYFEDDGGADCSAEFC